MTGRNVAIIKSRDGKYISREYDDQHPLSMEDRTLEYMTSDYLDEIIENLYKIYGEKEFTLKLKLKYDI